MSKKLNIDPINTWIKNNSDPLIISGPCSAETYDQLRETCKQLKSHGINLMRAGVWKPRTRPGTFEGNGEDALKWIADIKEELDIQFTVEVANTSHIELALKYGIDILWIGARTTVNPFSVQEIADAIKGTDTPVLIKNPINPDLSLWMGALERINTAGITKMGAIHRGFSMTGNSKYRYVPMWKIAIDLKSNIPNLPVICDPSHICGNRDMIFETSQKALDLGYDGLIIESHIDPDNAWSDAKQQVTPEVLSKIKSDLKVKTKKEDDKSYKHLLDEIREGIDDVDKEIVDIISKRIELVKKIGEFKKEQDLTTFQVDRWNEVFKSRMDWAKEKGLEKDFIEDLYKVIHLGSINVQNKIINKKKANSKI
ncbi:MAG: 3-deoxy-7-phosphoheptulonate synthase [Amoebophilaceae bacterium TMED152]|nr:MAG: 3-deoxy-7-phosphoheptulonate synthase [Amoebophilaceae bacterium TMED152]|tara:strand:- start:6049 stop:7155 length:1107 start_codon:yes stop_codon:yes gene_type:complete